MAYKKQPLSKEDSIEMIKNQCVVAMRCLMLQNLDDYKNEVDQLGRTCASLLMTHGEHIAPIVNNMEKSMTSSYLQNLKEVQESIASLMKQREGHTKNTFHGNNDFQQLTQNIVALEKSKNLAPHSLIDRIVFDVLKQATTEYDATIDEHFYRPA